jgi:hypothetical protein
MPKSDVHSRQWTDPCYWRRLCPDLTVDGVSANGNDRRDCRGVESANRGMNHGNNYRNRLREDGYALVNEVVASKSNLLEILCIAIEQLHSVVDSCLSVSCSGIPATFVLLYDETWLLASQSWRFIQQSTVPTIRFHYDILAWNVTNQGFSPHRDRQPDDPAVTFVDDDPLFVTHWISPLRCDYYQ